ncbi:MAG: phosphomannomutase [Proteobacteria bacterium]|nr:MAG: phosphomannomutase [Pseudomonadota bacterium]
MDISAFKAYDIRGRVPEQLDADMAERIGRAYVAVTGAKKVVVGYDIRLSSPELAQALTNGLLAAGADVYDIGLGGTEQVYFATFHYEMDGGIMVTASHNPEDYNGMKLVGKGSRPVSNDNGLLEIRALVPGEFSDAPEQGRLHTLDAMSAYIEHLLGYVDTRELTPLKIVVNAGNGGAGLVVDELEPHLPFEFIKVHHQPDGHFPHGVPNPLLPDNRESTRQAVIDHKAAMGIAWDGDFDRCFFFDETGRFIEGYYIVGLLAELFLARKPGAKIIHDPRLTWNTIDMVTALNGEPVQSKTGHAFIKQKMREVDAIYGGEMSAHHYFRDFAYCDSGMIPWLMVANLVCRSGQSLSQLIDERMKRYPASGEINRRLTDAKKVLDTIEAEYSEGAKAITHVDGLSIEYADWRFNLRMSNTEPLVRLNVESCGDEALMREKTEALLARIDQI